MRQFVVVLACAWVLWGDFQISVLRDGQWIVTVPSAIKPDQAFQSLEECREAGATISANIEPTRKKVQDLAPFMPTELDRLALDQAKSLWSYTYRCLPDTIDPRAPKR